MKQTVDFYTFREAFRAMNRFDQFGYEALEVLFDYLTEVEDGSGEELELDVIGLCCDYAHDTVEEIAANYGIDLSECEDDDEKRNEVREWILDATAYCGETETGFVYCTAF